MAKKKVATKQEKSISKAEQIAIDSVMERGLTAEEIAGELEIDIEIVRNYIDGKLLPPPKKEKVKGVPLPFAVRKTGDSSIVQMTQAASEISDSVKHRPAQNKRIDKAIYRPHS